MAHGGESSGVGLVVGTPSFATRRAWAVDPYVRLLSSSSGLTRPHHPSHRVGRPSAAGGLPFKAIIQVAGINLLWRASERSIRDSVRNALDLAHEKGFQSMAFPLIGAGAGRFNGKRAKDVMLDEFLKSDAPIDLTLVSFKAI